MKEYDKNVSKIEENRLKITKILQKLDEIDNKIVLLLKGIKQLDSDENSDLFIIKETILSDDYKNQSKVYKKVVRDTIKYDRNTDFEKVSKLLSLRENMLDYHINNKLKYPVTASNVVHEYYNDIWIDILRTKKET